MAVPTKSFTPEYPKRIGDKIVRTKEEEFHYRNKLAAQSVSITDSGQQIADLQAEVKYLNIRCGGLVTFNEDLKTENDKLKATIAGLRGELSDLTVANDQLKSQLASTVTLTGELQAQVPTPQEGEKATE